MKKINTFAPYVGNEETKAVSKVIRSGWLTSGKVTLKFENKIKKYLNCENALIVNSCTSGINSALHALNLKRGDEVITSANTFVSTINNLYHLGLKIKLVDIELNTYMLDLNKLKKAITKKTKCIIITHYGGIPFKIDKIINIIKKKKLKLLKMQQQH